MKNLTNEQYSLSVDLAGGRVMEFSLAGKNHLADAALFPGSTIWTAPQSDWDWPPPPALDSEPYSVVHSNEQTLELTSAVCSQLNIRLTKTFSAIPHGFRVTTSINNVSSQAQTYAPWQVSRVLGGHTYFYSATGPLPNSNLPLQREGSVFLYEHNPKLLTEGVKCFANNSGGWIANIFAGQIFIKRFPKLDAVDVAPGEGEVEVYAFDCESNPYVEVEVQGPYSTIASGAQTSWAVDWWLIPVPDDFPPLGAIAEVGQALAQMVQGVSE